MALDPLHGCNFRDRMVEMIGMVLVDTVTQDHLDMAHLLLLLLPMARHRHITEDSLPHLPHHHHTTGHHHFSLRLHHVTRKAIISHTNIPLILMEEDLLEEMNVSH